MNLWKFISFCFTFTILFGFLESAPKAGSGEYIDRFLSYDLTLSDWGLGSPSDIEFISMGVFNKKKGDELVVYDVRSKVPAVTRKLGYMGKKPEYEGDYFLVSHYNTGNTNNVGGYFFAFSRSPSKSFAEIDKKQKALSLKWKHEEPAFAGVSLHLYNFKLPGHQQVFMDARDFRYITFKIRGAKGGEQFMLRLADRLHEQRQGSVKIGPLDNFIDGGLVTKKWKEVWVKMRDIPKGVRMKELASLIFMVNKNSKGKVYIKDFAFTKKKRVNIKKSTVQKVAKAKKRKLREGMWLWETGDLLKSKSDQRKLVRFCKTHGITDLFLQVPYKATKVLGNKVFKRYMLRDVSSHFLQLPYQVEGATSWNIQWNQKKMRPLLKNLHKAGVRVYALDGAPHYALKEYHAQMFALIENIVEFNKKGRKNEGFDGIRYDIEPYQMAQFHGVKKEQIMREYLALLKTSKKLTKQANMRLGVDIPFWYDGMNDYAEPVTEYKGRPLSELILDIVDDVGIMDYRTSAYGADGIILHAGGELTYADQINKDVFIGLETVVLPNETIYSFTKNTPQNSRLIVREQAKNKVRLYFIPDKSWRSVRGNIDIRDNDIVIGQSNAIFVPAGKLTFQNKKLSDFRKARAQTLKELDHHKSFYGFITHSYESYRPWLQKRQRFVTGKAQQGKN